MQEKENIFKLTYLFHSGFAISANGISIIVDYWHDSDSNGKGFVHENILKSQDKVYVLCSHQHHDHFNPDILKWKDVKSDITYVFSSDILNAGLTKADDATYLKEGETFSDDNIFVKAFGSTDIGISFVIERNEKKIFHAGDLNNWHWAEESTEAAIRAAESAFTRTLRKLASYIDTKQPDELLALIRKLKDE